MGEFFCVYCDTEYGTEAEALACTESCFRAMEDDSYDEDLDPEMSYNDFCEERNR